MSRDENTRHVMDATAQLAAGSILGRFRSPKALLGFLGGLWLLLLVLFVASYSLLQGDGRTGQPTPEPAVRTRSGSSSPPAVLLYVGVFALSVGGALGFGFWKKKQSLRAYARGLRSPDPRALLAVVDGLFPRNSPIPDLEVYRLQARAVAHALHGQVEAARGELRQVTWEGRAPIVRALERGVEALIHLLCSGEHAQGLALARESLAMTDLPNAWPGAKQGRAFYEICVRMGEALTGALTPDALRDLELHNRRSELPLIRAMSAWGLRVAYERAGDKPRSEEMRRFLQEHAPYCQPLQQIPS